VRFGAKTTFHSDGPGKKKFLIISIVYPVYNNSHGGSGSNFLQSCTSGSCLSYIHTVGAEPDQNFTFDAVITDTVPSPTMLWIRIRPLCTYWTAGAGPDQNFNFDAVFTEIVSNIDEDPDRGTQCCSLVPEERQQ
jgi:hypothetical protein